MWKGAFDVMHDHHQPGGCVRYNTLMQHAQHMCCNADVVYVIRIIIFIIKMGASKLLAARHAHSPPWPCLHSLGWVRPKVDCSSWASWPFPQPRPLCVYIVSVFANVCVSMQARLCDTHAPLLPIEFPIFEESEGYAGDTN
eukprot:1160935-Pelagomonas_calceolata.AAC.2